MAKTITFDTGIVEYEINGAATVRFNPADVNFTERMYNSFMALDERQDEFKRRVDEIGGDNEEMFSYAKERDAEMREIIDALLGDGVADALFPDMNCYALADGMPVWINLMFAIAEEIRDAFASQQEKADPRIRKFNAKNEELMRKYRAREASRKAAQATD